MSRSEARKLGGRRCWYNGVPAIAHPARSGYVNVHLLQDPGSGSMLQRGTAPENCEFLDEEG